MQHFFTVVGDILIAIVLLCLIGCGALAYFFRGDSNPFQ